MIYLANGYLVSGPGLTLFYSTPSGSLAYTCPIETSTITVLSNGYLAAGISGSANGSIIDPNTGNSLKTLVGATGQMNALAPLSNSLLASVGTDNNVLIWNTEDGTLIQNLTGPETEGVSLVGLFIFTLFLAFENI